MRKPTAPLPLHLIHIPTPPSPPPLLPLALARAHLLRHVTPLDLKVRRPDIPRALELAVDLLRAQTGLASPPFATEPPARGDCEDNEEDANPDADAYGYDNGVICC